MFSKNYLLLSCIFLFSGLTGYFWYESDQNSENKACCSIEEFAKLANDKKFVDKHEAPNPIDFDPQFGKMTEIKVSDDQRTKAFMVPAKKPSGKYLFVFHEWWGLNDYVKKEAEYYYQALKEKVNVIALDLYNGKVATTPEAARELMQAVEVDEAQKIIRAVMDYAAEKSDLEAQSTPKFASIGWCFGGGWSLKAALMQSYSMNMEAVVMYYGMPVQDQEKLMELDAPVLGIFGTKDKWINPQVVADFEKNMKEADKKITVHNYEADHAFANPSNPNYEALATADAHKKTIKFLRKNLK